MLRQCLMLSIALFICGVSDLRAQSWDLAGDFAQGLTKETFNQALNPDWVWSYGYYPVGGPDGTDDGGFTLYEYHITPAEAAWSTPLNSWKSVAGPDADGNINFNFSADEALDRPEWGPGMSFEPNQVSMMTDAFPADGLWTSAVFTSPGNGKFAFDVSWENRVMNGDGTLVFLSQNHNDVIYEQEIDGFAGSSLGAPEVESLEADGPFASFQQQFDLTVGDTVSFGVSPWLGIALDNLDPEHYQSGGGLHQVAVEATVTLLEGEVVVDPPDPLEPPDPGNGLRLTAVTINATDFDGALRAQERWNTIAPHPAWEVWVKDGAIPGNEILNNTEVGDRSIDIPLELGEHTFTVGVSHIVGGDLCCDGYSLNLFLNGSPIALNGEESPSITGWVEPIWDEGDLDSPPDLEEQPSDGGTMGFPLQTFAPATLEYEDDEFRVELTDFFFTAKSADLDIDVMSTGSNVGPFVADGEPDAVGQFTILVSRIGGEPCDLNGDGVCDAQDIDVMTQNVIDGTATKADRDALVESASPEGFNTYIGDSDLNGQFDEQDIVAAFIAGQYLSGGAAGWADGDWDGNLTFDDQDFVAAFIAGGYLQGPRGAASVPEPSGLVLLVLGALAVIRRRR